MTYYVSYHFMIILIFRLILRWYPENYKVETINNKNISDSVSVSKNSIKSLFVNYLVKKEVLNIL